MQLLDDLYNETRRLFIAGSKLAKNDPRVTKFIPALEKIGEKAPVMKRLAEKYAVLTASGEPLALAEAGTLLYAVMATQGKSDISGDEVEVEAVIHTLPKTDVPHSRLKPIIEALTSSRQGRLEVLTKAYEDGLLRDFRLYGTLVSGLDDKYAAIGDYLYETVLPSLGEILIPYLLEQYDRNGKTGDARRLSLLHRLDYSGVEALAMDAAENGSAAVAPEAIRVLGDFSGNEEYLIKLAGDKKSAIREAALTALVKMMSPRGYEIMMELLRGAKYKSAIEAAGFCRDSDCISEMLGLVKSRRDELLTAEKEKEFREADEKFSELLGILRHKYTPEIVAFCVAFLRDKRYTGKLESYKMTSYHGTSFARVCSHLIEGPPELMLPVYEDVASIELAKKNQGILMRYFIVAIDVYSKERLYSVFSPYYDMSLIMFDAMFMQYTLPQEYAKSDRNEEAVRKHIYAVIDPRWILHFIKNHDMEALSVMLTEDSPYKREIKDEIIRTVRQSAVKGQGRSGMGKAVGRFAEITDKKKGVIFKGELEKLAEASYLVFEKEKPALASYFYYGIGTDNFMKLFYPEYKDKFESLAAKNTSSFYRDIMSLFAAASEERN